MRKILVSILLSFFIHLSFSNTHIVKTSDGEVEGVIHNPKEGATYLKFLGIPYAKPPIGDLRFRSPQPREKWEQTLKADKEPNICVQQNVHKFSYMGDEDCLYLNIYTPSLPDENKQTTVGRKYYPVMVWLHGGSFESGSGNTKSPDYLVQQDVIVVTLNYRLGVFGFLSDQLGGVTGNMGLKDQLLALKWIKNNIHNFNGDRTRITLFGTDAGAASIHYLMSCKKAHEDYLFHRVILQSGSAFNPWALQYKPRERALNFTRKLGFTPKRKNQNPDDIKNFDYTQFNTSQLYSASKSIITPDDEERMLSSIFVPVIENTTSSDAIITKNITESLMYKDHITVMIGFNTAEGLNLANEDKTFKSDWYNHSYDYLQHFLPREAITTDNDTKEEIYSILKYDSYVPVGEEYVHSDEYFVKMKGDAWFLYGVYNSALEFAKKGFKTYFYRLSFDGYSLYRKKKELKKEFKDISGVCHGDELFYLFKYKGDNAGRLKDADIVSGFREKVVRLWTTFAKNGNPTPSRGLIDEVWKPVDPRHPASIKYLDLNETIKMQLIDIDEYKRMKAWDDIYAAIKNPTQNSENS